MSKNVTKINNGLTLGRTGSKGTELDDDSVPSASIPSSMGASTSIDGSSAADILLVDTIGVQERWSILFKSKQERESEQSEWPDRTHCGSFLSQ